MRIPMPLERDKIRKMLEACLIKACGIEDDFNIIHNEIMGNVIEISVRLPQAGWPFAELCHKPMISNFMSFHTALLRCLLLVKFMGRGLSAESRHLERLLVERDFGEAFREMDAYLSRLPESQREKFAASEKAEAIYLRPELRAALYIVLNPKHKFIFNMQSSLTSDLALVKGLNFPRTCGALANLEDVHELILINLAQIRPDIIDWLAPRGLEILAKQKLRGWRGKISD